MLKNLNKIDKNFIFIFLRETLRRFSYFTANIGSFFFINYANYVA